jgi:hypothetical protein
MRRWLTCAITAWRVHDADNLRVYRDPEASVVVLEYEVHGESVQTGRLQQSFCFHHYHQGP